MLFNGNFKIQKLEFCQSLLCWISFKLFDFFYELNSFHVFSQSKKINTVANLIHHLKTRHNEEKSC
jgi:hypothetical protein